MENKFEGLAVMTEDKKEQWQEMSISKFNRNKNIDSYANILSIMQYTGKKLKINKSTLWYRQKKIKENKTLKVYNRVVE